MRVRNQEAIRIYIPGYGGLAVGEAATVPESGTVTELLRRGLLRQLPEPRTPKKHKEEPVAAPEQEDIGNG